MADVPELIESSICTSNNGQKFEFHVLCIRNIFNEKIKYWLRCACMRTVFSCKQQLFGIIFRLKNDRVVLNAFGNKSNLWMRSVDKALE